MKLKDNNSILPMRMSKGAACYDVFAHSIESINNYKISIGLGFMTEIPEGWKGVIVSRSGIGKTNWFLSNSLGVIDSDYRGEWKMILTCIDSEYVNIPPYKIGDRVGQIYFEPVNEIDIIITDELSETERGEGGWGSTGK